MFDRPITFDSFIRGLMVVLILVGLGYVLNLLSSVLLPFFIAWLLAYLLYPLVSFLQYRCRLRFRVPCIILAFLIVLAALAGLCLLVVPPTIEEFSKLSGLLAQFSKRYLGDTDVAPYLERFFNDFAQKYQKDLLNLVHEKSVIDALQGILGQAWNMVTGAVGIVIGLLGSVIVLLYMFFILMDYESICNGWVNLVPQKSRSFAVQLVEDVKNGMNAYFRGQGLIAFLVGVLFSIGFLIIDFPMAIGLGLFIGLLNLVPYLQTVGLIPAVLLALLKSANTGENFWWILFLAFLVFLVVQTIQDMVLTPKIMGHQMGLNPAVILLSLSVWGSLLGFIGLIIALPLTTLMISYYRRFILGDQAVGPVFSSGKGKGGPATAAVPTAPAVVVAEEAMEKRRQRRRRKPKASAEADVARREEPAPAATQPAPASKRGKKKPQDSQ